MPYTVHFDPPARPLERADVVFDVNWNKNKLGTLHVSKGSLVWVPANMQYGYRLDWKKFGALMEAEGIHGYEG